MICGNCHQEVEGPVHFLHIETASVGFRWSRNGEVIHECGVAQEDERK